MAGPKRPGGQAGAAGSLLEQGRASYERRAWADAFAELGRADEQQPLEVDDLTRLAWSAGLSGHDQVLLQTLERLHQAHLARNAPTAAARAAFWLGFRLMGMGEAGQAAGWWARAQRLVEGHDCAERGWLLGPMYMRHMMAGELEAALVTATEAERTGHRCQDRDLVAFARQMQGRALLRQNRVAEGLALLDEVMLEAKAGDISPVLTGIVYCSVIAGCHQVFAFDRAREWTAALAAWCEAQPQLVSFTGICLAHRAEILQITGDWLEAIAEAQRAGERCAQGRDLQAAASAHYQQGEIHRLRGEYPAAEAAYREASQCGLEPQPGLALLRLAQGDSAAAASATRRVLAATGDPLARARYLPAHVDIMLAVGDVADARAASEEIGRIARAVESEVLAAIADHARGNIALSEGDAGAALAALRPAFAVWQRIGARYLAARLRVAIGRACRTLGDEEGARLELDAARRVFEGLGAAPDLAALDRPASVPTSDAHGLTARELQVLRLVAKGLTNRAIAEELGLSEKTVDRHVSNIFTKVDVSTRAAATAFAYEHQLV